MNLVEKKQKKKSKSKSGLDLIDSILVFTGESKQRVINMSEALELSRHLGQC